MLSREAVIELQQLETDSFCNAITRALQDDVLPRNSELALHLMANREWYTIEEDGLLVHSHTSHPKCGQVLKQWVVTPALRTLVYYALLTTTPQQDMLVLEPQQFASTSAGSGPKWRPTYAHM